MQIVAPIVGLGFGYLPRLQCSARRPARRGLISLARHVPPNSGAGGVRRDNRYTWHDALSLFRENAIDWSSRISCCRHMDGFTLIRKLRDEAPDVPVIAISGMDDSQNFRDSASKCGANASLAKPLNRQHLVDLARRMVGQPCRRIRPAEEQLPGHDVSLLSAVVAIRSSRRYGLTSR